MRLMLAALLLLPQAKKVEWAEGFAGKWPVPAADAKSLRALIDQVRPSDDELKFKRIGWRSDFWAAVQEAKALQRPILLWSDQGHPLGGDFWPSINTISSKASVFNDDEVQALAKEFVPATAEVWGLRTGKGPASDFFRQGTNALAPGQSHGLYIIDPDAQNLGFHFIARPKEPVVALMKAALQKWTGLVKDKGYKPKPVPPPAEEAPPAGLQLCVNARDFPRPGAKSAAQWNQMRLTLTKEEADGLLPKGGASSEIPKELLLKLAKKTLVDGAKGNHAGFRSDDALKKGRLVATATASSGTQVTLKFEGEVTYEEGSDGYDAAKHGRQLAVAGDHRWDVEGLYGFDCRLFGTAVYDTAAGRFVRFELLASGQRKGGRPKDDVDPAPMGVAFTIEGQYAKPKPRKS